MSTPFTTRKEEGRYSAEQRKMECDDQWTVGKGGKEIEEVKWGV